MAQRQTIAPGVYPPTREFEPFFAMDRYLGSNLIHEIFPYQPSQEQPVVQVGLDHKPRTEVYNFSFTPTDWAALNGEHSKQYEAVVDQEAPMLLLNVFGTVAHQSFNEKEQADWVRFQLKNGMYLPHPTEVDEFLLIFRAFAKHMTSSKA